MLTEWSLPRQQGHRAGGDDDDALGVAAPGGGDYGVLIGGVAYHIGWFVNGPITLCRKCASC
jgi:hypothetical protein